MKKTATVAVTSTLFLASCLSLESCKEGKMKSIFSFEDEEVEEDSVEAFVGDTLHLFDEEEPPVAVDELFDDFFFNFASDARFQGQRVLFPLVFKDGEEMRTLSKTEWQDFNKFDSQEFVSVIYEREDDLDLLKDTTINSVSVEWIYLNENKSEIFNFNRREGKWTLTDVQQESVSNMPNGDFLEFYGQFVADSTFQRSALNLPVRLVLTAEGDEEAEEEALSADDWFGMKGDLPLPHGELINIDYGQTCISENRKTLMMEGVSNGMSMKFKFDKSGGEWKLIEIEI